MLFQLDADATNDQARSRRRVAGLICERLKILRDRYEDELPSWGAGENPQSCMRSKRC